MSSINKQIKFWDNDLIIHEFSDTFSEDGKSKIKSKGLGEKFVSIDSFFLDYLKQYEIPIAFLKLHNKHTLRYLKYSKLNFFVKILNQCDKRTAKIFNRKENEPLAFPLFEYHLCNEPSSMISESHLITFDLCSIDDIKVISRICSKTNAILKSYFIRRNSTLAEVHCYFGKIDKNIYLIDDFTPGSLKVFPAEKSHDSVNPYNLSTSVSLKHYTDYLHNLINHK